MPGTNTDRLQGLTTSVAVKAPCRVATTAAITLSGLQVIDSITVAANDRVLVKNQANTVQNGIYLAQVNEWIRAKDFDGTRDVVDGTYVFITDGTTQHDTNWRVSATNPVRIGTTAISWGVTSPEQGLPGADGEDGSDGGPGPTGTSDGNSLVYAHSANYTAVADDFGAILRFDASAAGAGGLVCTISRNLGSLFSAGIYEVHRIDIERDPLDASSNPIIVQNDLAVEVGRIISPVAGGMVPWLTAYADGTTVVCRGVP